MQMITMTLGLYETNCYLLYDEATRHAVLIDPGYEPERLLGALQAHGLSLQAILITHAHFDHVGATQPLFEATGCRIYVHPLDLSMPPYLRRGLVNTDFYEEGDCLDFDSLHFQVLHTPGHTPGCVILVLGDKLFCGDLLFRGSCGRTDGAGGSWDQMLSSLRRMAELPGDYLVYPGHGEPTTLARERQSNVFMLRALGLKSMPGL